MKRILFSLLALVGMTLTASAVESAYSLSSVESGGIGTISFTVGESVSPVTSAAEGADVTVTITPPTGFSIGTVTGEWDAAVAKTRTDIDMEKDITLTLESEDATTGAKTYSFKMIRANAVISVKYAKLLKDGCITNVVDPTYTGSPLETFIQVYDGSTPLTQGTDYTVSFSNNILAASLSDENAPTVTVTGIGNYDGTASTTFNIFKADVTLTAPTAASNLVYNGQPQTLLSSGATVDGPGDMTDVKILYSIDQQTWTEDICTGTDAKEYTVYYKVDGGANHNDIEAASLTVTISPAELTAVTLVSDKLAYNEQEQAAQVQTVKAGDITVPADGFDVTDNKGTNVGNYTAKVTGKGNFTGTVDVAWSIVEGTSSVTFSQKTYEKTFGDEDFTVEPTVTGDGTLVYSSSDEKVATVDSGTGLVHILGTGTVTITATMSGDNIVTSSDSYELTVSPKQTTVTIGATGMITYCGTEALDFTGNEDLEAYTVIGCSYGSNTIWMSRVYNVPAETPIVIKAAKEGTYELNIATSTDSYYLNRLVGNLSGSTIQVNETSEDGTVRNYYLKSGEFKKVSNYANIANGKAYLQMPASVADEKAGSAVDITLSSTGKSTLCSDVDLDFSGVEGLKAYVVTGYDMPTKTFWLNRVVEASAGTPLYLAGKANTTYSIPSKGVKTSFENMLVGNLSGSTIQVEEESEDGALRNLYLKEGTFKKVNNYVNIYNGKCYLQAPSDIVAAMARGMEDPDFNLVLNDELMSIGFSDIDDEATGIVPIENGQWTMDNSAGAWYDLQGRKLQGRPTRSGVYVNNGRKVVLK
jgi:hypothetical protein